MKSIKERERDYLNLLSFANTSSKLPVGAEKLFVTKSSSLEH
jgi:hypothetical protein